MDGKVGGQLGVSSGGISRIEVIEGRSGRRARSPAERARIAAESFLPGVRVADVARKHGTTRWQVYDWRKRLRDGRLSLPEEVAEQPRFARLLIEAPALPEPPRPAAPASACIAIEICGIVIRAGAEADEAHLARVIRAARGASA
ncbi:MAG TPA: transposase [Afifellaceae bacterium]|nr:transposase [Afifellaceae bacterium]